MSCLKYLQTQKFTPSLQSARGSAFAPRNTLPSGAKLVALNSETEFVCYLALLVRSAMKASLGLQEYSFDSIASS